ncbi:hypothetical protein MA16_Dca027563 [Dendrobium catenatum]|uniref:Uncharacterized protein n=1 Tax=Dendrobium catenatum TaxID=906689 RepID=A0A2I0VPK2_9ASPA|nr:hypothetical protein MA16_Dca027563 [Dendrobium catenatum]
MVALGQEEGEGREGFVLVGGKEKADRMVRGPAGDVVGCRVRPWARVVGRGQRTITYYVLIYNLGFINSVMAEGCMDSHRRCLFKSSLALTSTILERIGSYSSLACVGILVVDDLNFHFERIMRLEALLGNKKGESNTESKQMSSVIKDLQLKLEIAQAELASEQEKGDLIANMLLVFNHTAFATILYTRFLGISLRLTLGLQPFSARVQTSTQARVNPINQSMPLCPIA